MRAGQTTLRQLIGGEKQYRVPLFQRPYTWTARELKDLWDDLLEQYVLVLEAERSGLSDNRLHFIGGFVLAPQPMLPHGIAPYLVIDGQQRLTALLLALAAMRDALRDSDERAAERLDVYYLKNQSADGLERYKLLPTQDDREVFFSCIDGAGPGAADTRVAATHRFFRAKVGMPVGEDLGRTVDAEVLSRVILDRLSIVDIVTESGDNPNRIFESLNATGVRLTQADLLRNFVFMLLPTRQEDVYRTVWKPMERMLGDENLEGFARYNLLRQGVDSQKGDVYRQYQERLEPLTGNEPAVEAEVRDFARLAIYYRRLVDPRTEPDPQLQKHLTFLRRWGAQTTYPVLLQAFDLFDRGVIRIEELRGVAANIESFLVRRYVLGVSTNFLNRLFVDLAKQMPAGTSIVELLRQQLSADRRYWPTDDQIRAAVRTRPIYITGRADQRRLLFERLEESFHHQEPVDLSANLTIEHVMPQTLSDEWRRLLAQKGEDPELVHDELLHTIGNLSLTGYNSALSNNPFERKREMFESSHLELNREIRDYPSWGRVEILERADHLADLIIKIWPGPVTGAKGAALGFDWTRVDAAVAAIPAGRWTNYGDLALIGGTSPQAVGNRMLTAAAFRNDYRVLDSQGRIAEGFRWTDANQERSVLEVLTGEGVTFDATGHADARQKIGVLELAQLIAFEFEPEDLDRLERTLRSDLPGSVGLWLTDGRSWHLEYHCSPLSREILLAFEGLVRDTVPETGEASWNQKFYIAWRRVGKIWLTVHPRQSWLWVEFVGPPFTPQSVAEQLGFALVPEGESPSSRTGAPPQVQSGNGRIWIQLKTLADVDGHRREVIASLLDTAYKERIQPNDTVRTSP